MVFKDGQRVCYGVHEQVAGSAMRAPTEEDRKRGLWTNYKDNYHVDLEAGIVWHDDAPEEALESFRFIEETYCNSDPSGK